MVTHDPRAVEARSRVYKLLPGFGQEEGLIGPRLYDALARDLLQRSRISVRDTTKRSASQFFDKMVPAVKLLFENIGDDLTGKEMSAGRFLS